MNLQRLQPQSKKHAPPTTEGTVSPTAAKRLIQQNSAPEGMVVKGRLDFSNDDTTPHLPANLTVTSLNISGHDALHFLPPNLTCYELDASGSGLQSLPASLRVEFRLNLSNCMHLEMLPQGLKVGSLILEGCPALRSLPEGLDVYFLDIAGCSALSEWPQQGSLRIGRLDARGCTRLRSLPPWLQNVSQLNVRDCTNLSDLPDTLHVTSWIDLANTQIAALPAASSTTEIRWKGVPIDARIAFQPETIKVHEVLNEANTERRRVLLERMGYEKFLSHARAKVLDRDEDAGGERRLLQVPMRNDEDLVCLAVYCPSTGRQYMLRVPPQMRTCHQAAAWLAGYDNPADYCPLIET